MMNIDVQKNMIPGGGVASALWPRLRRFAFVTWKAFVFFAPVVLTAIGMVLAFVGECVFEGWLESSPSREDDEKKDRMNYDDWGWQPNRHSRNKW